MWYRMEGVWGGGTGKHSPKSLMREQEGREERKGIQAQDRREGEEER